MDPYDGDGTAWFNQPASYHHPKRKLAAHIPVVRGQAGAIYKSQHVIINMHNHELLGLQFLVPAGTWFLVISL